MIRNKRLFFTGGAGFIGTKLTETLSENNEIMIYDNLERNSIQNTDLLNRKNIYHVKGDILDKDTLAKSIKNFKPQVVVHMAAIAGIDTVIKNAVKTMKVNMIGTYNILESLLPSIETLERFIDFSTSEVFGSYAYKVDEHSTTNLAPVGEARWTYSVSKLAGEHMAYSYYKEYGLPAVSIRPFNVYGPGQVGEGAIHSFVVRALKNQNIQIHGDGDQIRSWCYINDFINGVLLCIEKDIAVGKIFNIGDPKGTVTINSLAELIVLISNSKSRIVHVPKTYVDVELRIPNIDKAREILGYEPAVSLKDGILYTLDWYRHIMDL